MQISPLNRLYDFVKQKISEKVFPSNAISSIPLVTQKGDRLFYVLFLYNDTPLTNETIERPFAWAAVPINDNNYSDFSFSYCSIVDFVRGEVLLQNAEVSTAINAKDSTEFTRELFRQELDTLIRDIASFAFNETLTDFQLNIVARFKELFLQTVYLGLYPYYDAIAEDFLEWIELTLVAKSNKNAIATEVKTDLQEQYRLMLPQIEKINRKLSSIGSIQKQLDDIFFYKNFEIEKEIILVIDHINKSIDRFPAVQTNNQQDELELITAVRQDLTDLLYRHSIEPFSVEGDNIDFAKQKVIRTQTTDDKQKDRTLCERLAPGWAKGDLVIRPEHVKAYLFK